MKNRRCFFIFTFMMLTLLSACSQSNTDQEAQQNLEESENIEQTHTDEEIKEEKQVSIEEEEKEVNENNLEDNGLITESGIFIGGIDAFSIEIEVNEESQVFAVSEEVSEALLDLELATGDAVEFQYEYNEDLNRNLVLQIKKQ